MVVVVRWVILLLAIALSSSAAAEVRSLVDGLVEARSRGAPSSHVIEFAAATGGGVLSVFDGEGGHRVSSALVVLNGAQVLGPEDFPMPAGFVEFPVALGQANSLLVEVRGKPGTSLQVVVSEEVCTDADADGFWAEADCGTPVDCADEDPGVFPGAPEVCGDGVDNQCPGDVGHGEVDEGCLVVSPVGDAGLVAYWPLDGGWEDVWGGYGLEPVAPVLPEAFSPSLHVRDGGNLAYGPTGSEADNGATSPTFTAVLGADGAEEPEAVTLEGWFWLPDNNTSGQLFGFGGGGYADPKLNVSVDWGHPKVHLGEDGARLILKFPRQSLGCWHHVALVVVPGASEDGRCRVYLDGLEAAPLESTAGYSFGWAHLFGDAFRLGTFAGASAGAMRVDEVRLWARALSPEEVATLAGGTGPELACGEPEPEPEPDPTGWDPGQRCVPPEEAPAPRMELGVRILSDDTVVVVSDPNPWLRERVDAECGTFLSGLEENREAVPDWSYAFHYKYAVRETILSYRPGILAALSQPTPFAIEGPEVLPVSPAAEGLWPQATRDFRVAKAPPGEGELVTTAAETVYFTYLRLPFRLQDGTSYRVTDPWGGAVEFAYAGDWSLSWAIKVNQVGYLPDAPKYAYLGGWLGPQGGALDLGAYEGLAFEVCREADGSVAYAGSVQARSAPEDAILTGEETLQLDFTPLSEPGRYYVRVAGLGRSWPFEVGQAALGEAFYVHARGLYHQRCGAELSTGHTWWPRGDGHVVTYRGGFPPDYPTDYEDHSAEGWGFGDETGAFPSYSKWFDVVAATATEEVVPGVLGGWHDAADFDRRPYHFGAVGDLAHAYLLFPENFTDGQLNLPEEGNGVPDILDEAVWGLEVFLRAQEADGRVGTWIEATSHPRVSDPRADTQRYYLSLATRNSSLHYAGYAALLGRALLRAGDATRGEAFVESARRAYVFGMRADVRVATAFTMGEQTHTWTEPETPDAERHFRAVVQLWLATGDPSYRAELDSAEMAYRFERDRANLHWQPLSFSLADIALAENLFPDGWGATARDRIVALGEEWLARQEGHVYRTLWYEEGHGYFGNMAWGGLGYGKVRRLVAAWRVSGDVRFRNGALVALDWFHGANPQGRVNTTGLGHHRVMSPLHLPSSADAIAEPAPGITVYGYTGSFPFSARTAVYGLFDEPRDDHDFAGSALAQLPPPWDDPTLTTDDIGEVLYADIPVWRRLVSLGQTNPAQSEFTVNETISPAAAVTGCLMGPGWTPPAELLQRGPASPEEVRDSTWHMP